MNVMKTIPAPPRSWSELSWQQLEACWEVKMRYGGNADVARAAALLALTGLSASGDGRSVFHEGTGEPVYTLKDGEGRRWTVTPRELSQMAKALLPWFDWPYGDPGEKAEYDENGKTVKERREPVTGYVGPMHDAMVLPRDTVKMGRRTFALPQVACVNISWQQYRSLQGIVPQLFQEGLDEKAALDLRAQFLSHILTPRSIALFDTDGDSIRVRPHWDYRYNAEQADRLVGFWRKHAGSALFHICLQCYQTALAYYAVIFPELFGSDGSSSVMNDALKGETGTINAVMKYAGYDSQRQVYDSELPFVLDILNTMTAEARQIKEMNAKMKRKR